MKKAIGLAAILMPVISVRKNGSANSRPLPGGKITPQQKLIATSKRFGNSGLEDNQGSTICAYDHLPLAEGTLQQGTEFRFFENASNRAFPLTNLMEGKLQVGEGLVLKRIWFTVLSVIAATGEVIDEQTFDAFGLPGLNKSDFEFFNDNNRVIKPMPLTRQRPEFNWKAWNADSNIIHLDTDITLQPLIPFVCALRTPLITVPASETNNYYMGCYIEGPGAILNPRTNY